MAYETHLDTFSVELCQMLIFKYKEQMIFCTPPTELNQLALSLFLGDNELMKFQLSIHWPWTHMHLHAHTI